MRRPAHATVVAYLALFAALGGTAIAAQDEFAAKGIKKPIVRERSLSVQPGNLGDTEVTAACKRGEILLSGASGWEESSSAGPATLRSIDLKRRTVIAQGDALNQGNTLRAQAVCLPR